MYFCILSWLGQVALWFAALEARRLWHLQQQQQQHRIFRQVMHCPTLSST
jgi:hypothetical protein